MEFNESLFAKFYKKSLEERREALARAFGDEVVDGLAPISLQVADTIIENVVGIGSLPIGLVTNLLLNGKRYVVPMMVEEPSVVAAANKACKLSLPEGFEGEVLGNTMLGMVSLKVKDSVHAEKSISENRDKIDMLGRELASNMEKYGGGWRGFFIERFVSPRGEYVSVRFLVDVGDAMGANAINTIAEGLAPILEDISSGKACLRILSNFAVYRRVRVKARFHIKEREDFMDAFELAEQDLYRVVTNNKGFMNGLDAVALATGQDFRALESAIHSYAMVNGNKPIATFYDDGDSIVGTAELPVTVGVVGGATKVLSHAQASLKMLGQPSASELALIMASIGLANNFAANYALATTGIQKGHMKLHARVIALSLGATPEEAEEVSKRIEGKVGTSKVKEILEELRSGKPIQ